MNYYANTEERDQLIAGLRDLADFLDRNPEVPAPLNAIAYVFPDGNDAAMFREIDVIAGLLSVTSYATRPRGHYNAVRDFGPVQYRAVAIPRADPDDADGEAE